MLGKCCAVWLGLTGIWNWLCIRHACWHGRESLAKTAILRWRDLSISVEAGHHSILPLILSIAHLFSCTRSSTNHCTQLYLSSQPQTCWANVGCRRQTLRFSSPRLRGRPKYIIEHSKLILRTPPRTGAANSAQNPDAPPAGPQTGTLDR